MCGLLGISGKTQFSADEIKKEALKMTHRGPDERDMQITAQGILCHERLAIIDLKTGKQPLKGCGDSYIVHNGEIYNHEELKKSLKQKHHFHSHSDSEVILHLFEEKSVDCLPDLDGIFAFIIHTPSEVFVARDPIGVKPLYYGYGPSGEICFSSEMKSLTTICVEVSIFPPGHYYLAATGEKGEFKQYYKPHWHEDFETKSEGKELNAALTSAVKKRLMSDVPLGVLLSGGLDSSLVASIVARHRDPAQSKLKSFSIGLDAQSPDLIAARKVADFIDTEHHEVTFTVEEGVSHLEEIIYHLETYDVTSIRASTPMYFLSRYIKKQGVKVVLSGEGADEIFGGYLYFHHAPSDFDFQKETVRRVKLLYSADLLRADKSTMAHGIEARVPFLDKAFLDTAMSVKSSLKRPLKSAGKMEKHILRAAFDDKEKPYLPAEILWRQKEQFSDGVGYSWIDELKAHCEAQVSDVEFAQAKELFPHNTPETKEAFYYRRIFAKHFPKECAAKTVKKWIPKWQKDKDPSGRASQVHSKAYEETTKPARVFKSKIIDPDKELDLESEMIFASAR